MIDFCLSSTDDELHQILKLQRENLPQHISANEALQEGFVTVKHDYDLLKAMQDRCQHILAKDGNIIAGYALSMHPDFGNDIEVLRPMFAEIDSAMKNPSTALKLKGDAYIVMGQICVDKAYRRQGIFRKLYEKMKEAYLTEYSAIITEVDVKNNRSLQAHYAVGFKRLSSYLSGGQHWELIYLE